VHRDHLKSYDGRKIQEKFDMKGLVHSFHPPYSPELSPCDFWFSGMAKDKREIGNFTHFKIFSVV
jgi:hypothetical protein